MPRPIFGEVPDRQLEKRRCVTCHYFRFVRLVRWCSHPEINRKIKNAGSRCKSWSDRFEKKYNTPKVQIDDVL